MRAGRDEMRATLLSWLPEDLHGRRILDAGCGTGAFAVAAARRGAHVVAIDLSVTLVELARERAPRDLGDGSIEFRVGDMLDREMGWFDHVVGMDSLIHYRARDMAAVARQLAAVTSGSLLFTFAPRTALLTAMLAVGRLVPRGDRSPAIEPIRLRTLSGLIAADAAMAGWRPGRTRRISSGFYKSQALELVRA